MAAVVTDEKTVRFPLLRPSHLMLTSQFDMHKVISKHWGENPGMPTALQNHELEFTKGRIC